jgi:competence protein ComEC
VTRFACTLVLLALAACRGRAAGSGAGGRDLVVARVMADPVGVADERGEWIEIANRGAMAADLRDWSLRSGNDAGYVVRRSLVVAPGASVRLARAASVPGEPHPALVYSGITLANGADWLVLRDPEGRTRDSLAWSFTPRGVAIEHGTASAAANASGETAPPSERTTAPPTTGRELVVRVLDVGQGDAILIQNGGSTVLVDGGPERRVLARWLDRLGVRDTLDAVILTHAHVDHFGGLPELFRTRRALAIRYVWWNGDPAPALAYSHLPDSVEARARRGETILRDTDDPCGDGRAICDLVLRGGARLHIMRPRPGSAGENDRSVALKLVGPDSASFTMWLAGDAEREELRWFLGTADYDRAPGMRADVLKADHHGSCDGVTSAYLDAVRPSYVVASLAARNDYGHMHSQAKAMYSRHRVPWYRTDQNGTITIRSPGTVGGGYTVSVERGTTDMSGPSDRRSRQPDCAGM